MRPGKSLSGQKSAGPGMRGSHSQTASDAADTIAPGSPQRPSVTLNLSPFGEKVHQLLRAEEPGVREVPPQDLPEWRQTSNCTISNDKSRSPLWAREVPLMVKIMGTKGGQLGDSWGAQITWFSLDYTSQPTSFPRASPRCSWVSEEGEEASWDVPRPRASQNEMTAEKGHQDMPWPITDKRPERLKCSYTQIQWDDVFRGGGGAMYQASFQHLPLNPYSSPGREASNPQRWMVQKGPGLDRSRQPK